ETRILRPQIDIGSNILLLLGDVHAAACGIEIEGLRPFDASQGFFDSLTALWHPKSGFPHTFTLIPDFFSCIFPGTVL
ncbi:MAG: hypothetical protein IKP72_11000, partial [Clostridia bacterium]|nr:hypothetical protein [Clostridia bacterium]